MPTINRKQIRPKVEYKKEDCYAKFYNSKMWRLLRNDYFMSKPLCECCMDHGVVKEAVDVHHKRIWAKEITDDMKWKVLLDRNNLMSVCSRCHSGFHVKAKRYGLNYVDELTDDEYVEAHEGEMIEF